MTFDACPGPDREPLPSLDQCSDISVCDLSGAERFLVWALRWKSSLHDDEDFAAVCLQDSFERAGLAAILGVFRRYAATVHGLPCACPPSSRLGCWRINAVEARTLHAVACLQDGRFGDAWHALSALCGRRRAAQAMLSLGEIADAFAAQGALFRPWSADGAGPQPRRSFLPD